MKEKKRLPLFWYWIFMIVLFLIIMLSQNVVAGIMGGSLVTSRFGEDATFEILWAGLVLVVVLLFKNKYIFTQKREGFFKSFQYILPELLLSGFFILISVISMIAHNNPIDKFAIFNLMLYCLFVGIVEEFLCRGWLLNEFLERYSRNRKEIILSILASSFIFGVVHFINIGETQGLFETLVQVLNAFAGGVFFALVYYKTKNIWVTVASHAIWDFSLFLSQANSLGDCLAATPTTATVILNVVRGIILVFAYGFFCYWLYRQTDLYEKEVKSTQDYWIAIGITIYIICLLFVHGPADESLCPDYTRKKIDDPYKYIYDTYDDYKLSDSFMMLTVDENTGKLKFRDTISHKEIFLTEDSKYYDYLLVENKDSFAIVIQVGKNSVLYGNFDKRDLRDSDFLNTMNEKFVKHVTLDLSGLGVIEIDGDDYKYPMLRGDLAEQLYFDQDGKLYINN